MTPEKPAFVHMDDLSPEDQEKRWDNIMALFDKKTDRPKSAPTPTSTATANPVEQEMSAKRREMYQQRLTQTLDNMSPTHPDYERVQTALTIDREDAIVNSRRGRTRTEYEFKPEYVKKYDARTLGIVGEQELLRFGAHSTHTGVIVDRD